MKLPMQSFMTSLLGLVLILGIDCTAESIRSNCNRQNGSDQTTIFNCAANGNNPFTAAIRQKVCSRSCPNPNIQRIPVVYFSDATNFDDTVAIFLLLKAENIDLKLIYINGNAFANAGPGIRNVYNIVDWFGRTDVQVVVGSFYSLLDERSGTPPDYTFRSAAPAGDGGLLFADTIWGLAHLLPQSNRHYVAVPTATPETSDDVLAIAAARKVIAESPEKVTLLSAGSLTGPFKVLDGAPAEVINNIRQFRQMGGAVDVPGNLFSVPYNTAAEFNLYFDPQAAQSVFTILANAGIPIMLDPLDATNTVPVTRDFLNRLRASIQTPEALFVSLLLDRVADTWFDPVNLTNLFIWDVTSALALIDPSVIAQREDNVGIRVIDQPASITTDVDTAAETVTITTVLNTRIGKTQRDPNGNPVDVLKAFDANRVYTRVIELINSDANPVLCPLRQPIGCYQYINFQRISR